MTDQTQAKLRELLLNEFSESELEQLCKDIGLNYVALPGAGTFGKTREMVEAARSQDKLRLLQSRLRELRPTAYASANIQIAQPIESAVSATNIPSQANERSDAKPVSWLPILAIALVALLCVGVVAALVLNRPDTVPIAAVSTATSAQVSTQTTVQSGEASASATVTLAETQAPPAIKATAEISTATLAATNTPVPLPSPTVTISPTESALTVTVLAATVTVAPTIAPAIAVTTAVTGTPTANQAHPAALMIRDLNEQLPKFYLGQVTPDDLQKYWAGDAWRSVVGFGTTKLPRVMRVPPAQRSSLDVTYNYIQLPTLQSERAGVSVVTAREFWQYVNAANAIKICEVRDYVYNVIEEGGQLKVRNFTSRLLQTGCPK